MEKYLFSLEAVSSMLVECYRAGNNFETGGILIGPKKHKRIITDSLASTPFAEREAYTYYQSGKDVEILNTELKEYQSKGYDFKGYFHRHPSGMYQLSQGDISTCIEILQSPSYCINNNLVMCIITETAKSQSPIFSYVVSLDSNGGTFLRNIAIKVLPKKCIQEFIGCYDEDQLKKGDSHETCNSGQDSEGTEESEKREPFRPSGERDSHSQLSGKEEGT